MATPSPDRRTTLSFGPLEIEGKPGVAMALLAGLLLGALVIIVAELTTSFLPKDPPPVDPACGIAVDKLDQIHASMAAIVTRLATADGHGTALREQMQRALSQLDRLIDRTSPERRRFYVDPLNPSASPAGPR